MKKTDGRKRRPERQTRSTYERAFRAATGKPLLELATISGRAQLDIMRETLRRNRIEAMDDTIVWLATELAGGYDDARGSSRSSPARATRTSCALRVQRSRSPASTSTVASQGSSRP